MADERRRKRKEVRLVQNEASWLQKVLFALGKAENAHNKLAKFREEEPGDYLFTVDGREASVDDIEEAVEERVEVLMQTVREQRQRLR